MSRTIRRKNSAPHWITSDWVGVEIDEVLRWRAWDSDAKERVWVYDFSRNATVSVRVRKEGKELKKALSKYHSDSGCKSFDRPCKWFRQNEQQTYRAKCRVELNKYLRNEDHAVMILANPKLPYWD